MAGNSVVNCGFESDLSGWTIVGSSSGHVMSECLSGTGCIELTHDEMDPLEIVYVSQCIPITPDTVYSFAVNVRVTDGTSFLCELASGPFIGPDCRGGSYGGSFAFLFFPPSDSWAPSPDLSIDTSVPAGNIGPDNQSLLVTAACRGDTTFSVRFDDLSLFVTGSP
jgi:hypothetical protein